MPTAKEVRIGKRVAALPGGHRGAAWDKTKQQQKQESPDQRQGMSGAGEYRCGYDGPRDLSAPLLFPSLQHGKLEPPNCQNCKSHLNHSFNALALSCTELDERIRQVCREELSVKEGIQDRITRICREEISKLQANELSQKGVSRMVDNTEEYCKLKLGKNEDHWNGGESRKTYIEPIANVVGVRKCKCDTGELCKEGNHWTGKENREGVRRRKCQTNKIDPSCKVEFDGYRDEMCRREFCEPWNRSGYGRSHKYRKIDIERDANEMNVNVEILLGQDCVNVKLLLDTGAQRSFISTRVYEAKLETRTTRKKCYVRMYGVGGQELATTGEVELDVQLGTDIVCQKFIIADIVEDGILGFDFCKAHQAEWKWADDELHLDV